jgi:beta-RFAP synthase
MFSFGRARERQFGGVGVMVERPGVEVIVGPSETLQLKGHLADRTAGFVQRWREHHPDASLKCQIEIVRAAPQHAGLGTGTQVGLAVAAALNAYHELPQPTAERLSAQTGRGERSAIGTYGFLHGGLLVEAGKHTGDLLSPLVARVELPSEWRFVLIRVQDHCGLSGQPEKEAFQRLPPVPERVTAELCRQVLLEMLPAAQRANFDQFGESIYQFGRAAGMCFAERQGGSFAGPHIEQLVAGLRDVGIHGVGQSSWGPTVFALAQGDRQAEVIVDWLHQNPRFERVDCQIASVQNAGARVTTEL